jgi:ATP-dependent DNA helicase RecQ
MASDLPSTEEEFLAIPGVGTNKLLQYGNEFMEVIQRF